MLLAHELGEVVDVIDHRVARAVHPLRVAVTAQVGRDHVVAIAQRQGDPVPGAAMVASAVDEDQRRRGGVALARRIDGPLCPIL